MSPLAQHIADRVRGTRSRWPAEAFPPEPATAEALATAEQTLGFPLPPLLRELYLNVRNGTFGPGSGLLPVGGRKVGNPGLCLEVQYAAVLRFGADELEDPTLQWPQQLLPLCHWGCEIWSCTQCGTDDYPIVRFDANRVCAAGWSDGFARESPSLHEWLEAWLREDDAARRPPRT